MDSNKKTGICIIFILAVILLISGCKNEVPPNPQNETPLNESEINVSPNVTVTEFNFIKVKSINLINNNKTLPCHYSDKLKADSPIVINDSKIVIKFELINLSNDSVKVKINNDKEVLISSYAIAELNFENEAKILVSSLLIREDYVLLCVNTNEDYDIAFCESKSGSERFLCFDNLGYLNGVDYCQKIQDSTDKRACEGGALGTNG